MLLLFGSDIVDSARKHKGHILVRQQHCFGCNKVLAMEITDELGARGEYWVVKERLITKGRGSDFLYQKKVWFGNFIKCPNCGREGHLPIDKPLTAEQIALPKEVKDGTGAKDAGAETRQGTLVNKKG